MRFIKQRDFFNGKILGKRKKASLFFYVAGRRRGLPPVFPVHIGAHAFVDGGILLGKVIVIFIILKVVLEGALAGRNFNAEHILVIRLADIHPGMGNGDGKETAGKAAAYDPWHVPACRRYLLGAGRIHFPVRIG